jgi:hypothetical protein
MLADTSAPRSRICGPRRDRHSRQRAVGAAPDRLDQRRAVRLTASGGIAGDPGHEPAGLLGEVLRIFGGAVRIESL